MSDQPLTLAVFEKFQREVFGEFQRKVFQQFVAVGGRFDTFEARVDARFDEMTGQIDGLSHRLLRLEDGYVLVKEALKRLEASEERGQRQLRALDNRLRRIEKRFEQLVTVKRKYALRTDVQDLRGRVADLRARLGAVEKRSR